MEVSKAALAGCVTETRIVLPPITHGVMIDDEMKSRCSSFTYIILARQTIYSSMLVSTAWKHVFEGSWQERECGV